MCHRRSASCPAGRAAGAGPRGAGRARGPRGAAAQPGGAARDPDIAGTPRRAAPPAAASRPSPAAAAAAATRGRRGIAAPAPRPPRDFGSRRHGAGAVCRRLPAALKSRRRRQSPRRAFEKAASCDDVIITDGRGAPGRRSEALWSRPMPGTGGAKRSLARSPWAKPTEGKHRPSSPGGIARSQSARWADGPARSKSREIF